MAGYGPPVDFGSISGGSGFGGLGLGGALIGGQILSGLGGFFGAQSANRNARRYQDEQAQNQAVNNNRQGYSFFGMGPSEDFMAAGNYTAGTPATRGAASDRFNASIGGPILGQYQALNADAAQGGADISRGYQADTARLRGVAGSNISTLGNAYRHGIGSLLGQYDQGAQSLMGTVDQYGKGRESLIRRDAEKDRVSMDARSRAALASSGLGNSTAVANSLSGNARRTGEMRDNALQTLADSQIDRKVGLGKSFLSERTGYAADANTRGNDALERGLGSLLNLETGRSTGQTQLDETALNRNIGMRQNTLGTTQNMISQLTQPGSQQYIPQYSLAGTALNSAGQGMGSIASLLALQQLYGGG